MNTLFQLIHIVFLSIYSFILNPHKNRHSVLLLLYFVSFGLIGTSNVHAQFQLGTSFTYQGRLTEQGNPVNGMVDMEFALYNRESGGSIASSSQQLTVNIQEGLFTVLLDFGASTFDGEARWLAVAALDNTLEDSSVYELLKPLQPLTATPYAIYSLKSGVAKNAQGQFSGNAWNLQGNNVGTNSVFLGTKNRSPLRLITLDKEALRLEPGFPNDTSFANSTADNTPNVVGGHKRNEALGQGGAIGGGGTATGFNKIASSFGTIAGGANNRAGGAAGSSGGTDDGPVVSDPDAPPAETPESPINEGNDGVIDGPVFNSVQANVPSQAVNIQQVGSDQPSKNDYATVGGGLSNQADGSFSTVPGGTQNKATGSKSFAAGSQANAQHDGSFVWSDSTTGHSSTTPNQFYVGASGGAFFSDNVDVNKNLIVNNDSFVRGKFNVTHSANFQDHVEVGESVVVNGTGIVRDDFRVRGDLQVNTNALVKGSVQIDHDTNVDGQMTIKGKSTRKDTLVLQPLNFVKNFDNLGSVNSPFWLLRPLEISNPQESDKRSFEAEAQFFSPIYLRNKTKLTKLIINYTFLRATSAITVSLADKNYRTPTSNTRGELLFLTLGKPLAQIIVTNDKEELLQDGNISTAHDPIIVSHVDDPNTEEDETTMKDLFASRPLDITIDNDNNLYYVDVSIFNANYVRSVRIEYEEPLFD